MQQARSGREVWQGIDAGGNGIRCMNTFRILNWATPPGLELLVLYGIRNYGAYDFYNIVQLPQTPALFNGSQLKTELTSWTWFDQPRTTARTTSWNQAGRKWPMRVRLSETSAFFFVIWQCFSSSDPFAVPNSIGVFGRVPPRQAGFALPGEARGHRVPNDGWITDRRPGRLNSLSNANCHRPSSCGPEKGTAAEDLSGSRAQCRGSVE